MPSPEEPNAPQTDTDTTPEGDAPIGGDHARFPSRTRGNDAANRAFAVEAARLILDDKCHDVVVLDVRGLSQVTDYIVIGSGTSDRQMRSALDDVAKLGAEQGFRSFRTNADERATWLLADFVDVVVHLFEPNTRALYDLEMLWGDADRIEWMRPGDRAKNRPDMYDTSDQTP